MAKAIGIGGVFLHFKGEKKELFKWYEKNLGFEFSEYGTGFLDGEQLMILSFKRDDKSHVPYLNLRVDDIDTLIKNLKEQNIKVLYDIKEYSYGKFATFLDPFGNSIELWEANSLVYKEMVRKEIQKYKK